MKGLKEFDWAVYWEGMFRFQTAMRYADMNDDRPLKDCYRMADEDIVRLKADAMAVLVQVVDLPGNKTQH